MRNECTHRYSLDCCSPFAFHVSRERLGLCFATAVFHIFVIVKHSKVMFGKKNPLLCLEEPLHASRFSTEWVGGKRKVELGLIVTAAECVCVCSRVCVYVCACLLRCWVPQWGCCMYVLWLKDRSWQTTYGANIYSNCNCIMNLPL